MIQEKTCKPENKAKDYSDACGKTVNVKRRKFGLCTSCFWDWMHTTENGKIYYQKQFLPKTKKVSEKNRKKITKESKINLMTPDKYRAKYLQPTINKIARQIDFEQPCTATGNVDGKMAGGHYLSVGSNRTTALNLHNIHIQSFHSNSWKGGDDKNYQRRLKEIYGERYFDFIDGLRKHTPLKLTLEDMKELQSKALKISNDLKNNLKRLNPNQRIMMRNLVNKELNIYQYEFSQFKIKEF